MVTEIQHDFGPIHVYIFTHTHICTELTWKLPLQDCERPFVQAHAIYLTSGIRAPLEAAA